MEYALPKTANCDTIEKKFGKFDTIVLSAGHHLMITDHGQTPVYPERFTSADEFVQVVRQTVETFLSRCPPRTDKFKTRRVIWITPPAYRPPYTKFRWDDHRTNTRISQYNLHAMEMLRRDFPAVAIIDQFPLLLPFVRETVDGLHAYGTDAAYPIALEVNHKVGIGKPRGWWDGSLSQRDEPQQTYSMGLVKPTPT